MQASDEIKIAVDVYQDNEGYFIGEAVNYPGVMAFAKDEETLMDRLVRAYFAITRVKAYRPASKTEISLTKVGVSLKELRIPQAA